MNYFENMFQVLGRCVTLLVQTQPVLFGCTLLAGVILAALCWWGATHYSRLFNLTFQITRLHQVLCAFAGLLTGEFPDPVTIRLPRGQTPSFALALAELNGKSVRAGVVKDAGDDPDVTHGATIIAEVAWAAPGSGIGFAAGDGVGTVTRPGLQLAVGEPAINPAPRAMIRETLTDLAEANGAPPPDVTVTIAIPGGERLAEKTMNARLGIVGGLSILGTTGIVVPYSCASWIHSIHRGIDVARAAGLDHIAAATGTTSERAVQRLYALPDHALIDMGDFVGGTLKYLRSHPVARLT